MDLKKLTALSRTYLGPVFIFSLLLFYIASGFNTKGFGYFMTLFLASLTFILCGVTLYTFFSATERKAGTFKLLQLAYWLALFSLLCYFIQIDFFWTKFAGDAQSITLERLRQILQIIYFSGFAIVATALIAGQATKTEAKEAVGAILTLGGLLFFLVALNYWSHIRPAQVDMTLMRKFSLSQDSRDLLKGIEGDVKITAFYPFFSDMYRDVELMLRDAAAVNGKISYTFIDPLREKNLADEKKVDRIGTILIETKDLSESDPKKQDKSSKFEILDEDAIKRLERELVSNILQVSGKKRTIYYSQGHDEKSITGTFRDDTIGTFDENLRALRHQMKQLSPAEGYPAKMPAADLVMIIGPKRDFTAQEKATLKKYFEDGGKLFVALDPESGADFSFLLAPLKVKYIKDKIHSDFSEPPGKTTIQSANYSEHAITAPFVKREEERKLTLFPGAGYLDAAGNESAADYDINYFLLSHFSGWIDKIPNGVRDEKAEPIATYKIGMAVKSKKNAGRLVFVGDSDFLVNKFIEKQQNKDLAMRMVGWVTEDEKLTGIVAGKYDDEKVKLAGPRDTAIFHIFLYVYPGIILLVGFFVVRSKRRRMSDSAGRA